MEYDLKTYYIVNKKLRRPKSKIIAGLTFLPIAIQNNVRFELDQRYQNYDLTIDDIKITYHFDAIYDTKPNNDPTDYRDGFDIRIGQGIPKKKNPKIISSPWSEWAWRITTPATPPLSQRDGWCCIMTTVRPQRDIVYDLIGKKFQHQFDQSTFFQYDQHDPPPNWQNNFIDLTDKMIRMPTSDKSKWNSMQNNRSTNYLELNPDTAPGYTDLCEWHFKNLGEIVVESAIDFFYPNEKTYKPISAGMPFVVVSCRHFLKKLRRMGFKTFHPFIDESYDEISNLETRVQKAIGSFFTFIQNKNNLDDIQKICDHNRNILLHIQTHHHWHDRVWKKIRRFIEF